LQSVEPIKTTSAAHIDWVHFDRVAPVREKADTVNATTANAETAEQNAFWLNQLGHRLDRK
jgi:hypothetical protein